MRRRTLVILALVLVFALMFTACTYRRPLQTPTQQQNNTGMNDNNRGNAAGTGTRTGAGTTWPGAGAGANSPYDVGYGYGNNGIGYGGYGTNYAGNGNFNYGGIGGNVGYGGYGTNYNYRNAGGTNNSPNFGMNNTGGANQADGIERSLEQMTGIDNATVVVNGNTAYVGIDTDRAAGTNVSYGNTNDIASVKRACAQRVRSANPNIQTVYVSTDANFTDRLRRVGEGVRNGSPVSTFRNELDTLIRGISPDRQ